MKDKIKVFWKEKGAGAIAPTLVVTSIFFVTYFGFGIENSMIGPFATLSFLRFRDLKRHYSCMAKTFVIYVVMALLSYVALINVPLCIIVNGAALFWICSLLIDEYQMSNYFPPGMALIFFQIAPISTPGALLTRIEALAASFLIVFVFLFVLNIGKKNTKLEDLASEGQMKCYLLSKAIKEGDDEFAEKLKEQICKGNRRMSAIIYETNRSAIRSFEKVNVFSRYVGLFEACVYEATSDESIEEKLNNIEVLLQRIAYVKKNEANDNRRLKFRHSKFDIRLVRFRFGLRQVFVTMPSLVFAYVTQFPNAYWLTISIFFMLIPYQDNTANRVKQRVVGTLRGILFCMLLFFIFRGFYERVAIMTIFNFLIYTAGSYDSMVSYITASALALNAFNSGVLMMLIERVIYTLVGALITLITNKRVFATRKDICALVTEEELEKIRDQIENEIPFIEDREEKLHRVNECVIKAYMLGNSYTQYTSEDEAKRYLHPYMMGIMSTIRNKIDPDNGAGA